MLPPSSLLFHFYSVPSPTHTHFSLLPFPHDQSNLFLVYPSCFSHKWIFSYLPVIHTQKVPYYRKSFTFSFFHLMIFQGNHSMSVHRDYNLFLSLLFRELNILQKDGGKWYDSLFKFWNISTIFHREQCFQKNLFHRQVIRLSLAGFCLDCTKNSSLIYRTASLLEKYST